MGAGFVISNTGDRSCSVTFCSGRSFGAFCTAMASAAGSAACCEFSELLRLSFCPLLPRFWERRWFELPLGSSCAKAGNAKHPIIKLAQTSENGLRSRTMETYLLNGHRAEPWLETSRAVQLGIAAV